MIDVLAQRFFLEGMSNSKLVEESVTLCFNGVVSGKKRGRGSFVGCRTRMLWVLHFGSHVCLDRNVLTKPDIFIMHSIVAMLDVRSFIGPRTK